jgi:hypothetical protein
MCGIASWQGPRPRMGCLWRSTCDGRNVVYPYARKSGVYNGKVVCMDAQTRKFWLTELFLFITVDKTFKYGLWGDIPLASVCRFLPEIMLKVGAASGGT